MQMSNNSASTNRLNPYPPILLSKDRPSNPKIEYTEQQKVYQKAISPSKGNSQIHEIKQKIFQISKVLAEHASQISIIKQSKKSLSSYSSCDTLRGSNQSDTAKEVHKEIDSALGDFQTHINKEIKKLKNEILDLIPSREDIISLSQGLEIKIQTLKSNFVNKQLSEISNKIDQENILVREELFHRIKTLHEANRKVFAEIERDMKEFNIQIQKLSDGPTFLSSNKKFYSPIILKYKEFMERIGQKQQIALSQSTYYLDTEGCLLDNSCFYLTDKEGKQIQLEKKHIELLRQHKILN